MFLNWFQAKLNSIAIIDASQLTKEIFIKDYYKPRIPLLVKGGAKNWSIMQKWSKEYIIETSGDYECTIVSDSRPASAKITTSIRNYFEKYTDKSTLTLEKYQRNKAPAFLNDIELPNDFFSKKDIARFFFYHSNKDGGTLPHNHGDAFNILQSGKKHWIFYDANKLEAPNGNQRMHFYHQKYPVGTHAKDFFKSELKSLSKNVSDTAECFQEAGDIIYVPRQYCHAVLNKSEVMGLVVETFLPKK